MTEANNPEAGTSTISVDQFIAAPPAKVWRALTEPERLARWWVPGRRRGHGRASIPSRDARMGVGGLRGRPCRASEPVCFTPSTRNGP